jgi:hypothetical protein
MSKTPDLKDETMESALKESREQAAKVARRGKDIDRVLTELDLLVDRQAALVREYQRVLLSKATGEALANVERRLERARALAASPLSEYNAVRFTFDSRRYEEDAASNQKTAYLYDVQVLQASARSDRHLKRSFGFIIAMLIAQVGVTIASLALAMNRRFPVWALGALSGVLAVLFGVYVLLELGPLVW